MGPMPSLLIADVRSNDIVEDNVAGTTDRVPSRRTVCGASTTSEGRSLGTELRYDADRR